MGLHIKSLLTEYGIKWCINRIGYSAKLKMLRIIPISEAIFEKNVFVKRINIFNSNSDKIQSFLKGLNKDKQNEIIRIADNAINGIILGFSSIEMDYGSPINWHLNPITGIEGSKNKKWYRIPDFDKDRGDIKAIWEASRFTHFFSFVRAYMITEDIKYYKAFSEQLDQWIISNPYPYGANHKCGQECALRMMNSLLVYSVFKEFGVADKKTEENVYKLVENSYKKILSNFFYAGKCIKNNHTLSELCGMIIGSWCCEDEKRLKKAYELLDNEIKAQFSSDGGYIQCSFNYQRFAMQLMEYLYKLGERTHYKISGTAIERIKKSTLKMHQLIDYNGDMPNYGSNDGALIFPLTCCNYRDFRPVINTTYALSEGKRLFASGDYDEELLWFGSVTELPVEDIKKKSMEFKESGHYVIHHETGYLMICLQDYKNRPGHMDQMHIDLWHRGVNIFCDTGTYSYASGLGRELAKTSGHNTAKLPDIEQMNKHGPFLIYDWTSPREISFDKNSFTGTMVSKNGYTHRRTVHKTNQGYEIEDLIQGNSDYCEFLFHTPCEVQINPDGFEIFDSSKPLCKALIDSGKIEVKKSFRSLYYLKNEEINCVFIKKAFMNKECKLKTTIFLTKGEELND